MCADLCQRPFIDGEVLALCCSLLLNLSSYVPAQTDMCDKAAFLLLRINKAVACSNETEEKQGPQIDQEMGIPQVSKINLHVFFIFSSPILNLIF